MKKHVTIFLIIVLTLLSVPNLSFAGEAPKQLSNKVVEISAGASHVMAITESGMLIAWGSNGHGELGDGTNIEKTLPVQIGTASDWYKISAGSNYSMAIKKDGTLWAWGNNTYGQLGTGNTIDQETPIKIGTDNDWIKVDTGENFSIALKKDGTMWLSQIRNSNDVPLFKKIDKNIWSDLSAGSNHLLALKPDGTLWSWGNNGNGELGIGTNNSSETLVQVGTDNDWVKISAGSAFSIAQKKDNSIWKWGANSNNINALSPKKNADNMNFKSLSTSMHTMGVKVEGTLWTLGRDNGTGQIFDDGTIFKQVGKDTNWVNVQTGVGYTIGLKTDGTLWSWGYNKYGQLGNGTQTDKLIPVQIGNKNNWTQVSSSGEHTVATDTYGDLWAWGQNFGYLGDGTWNTKYSPEKISTVSNVTYIQAGWYSNYVINKDNALYDWGINSDYQLGDGTNNTIYEPKLIGTSQDWKSVSSNSASTFGLKKDGTLWFWGTDSNGSFFGSRYPWKIIKEPIQIGIDSDWEKISVGNIFVIATKKDGSLWVGGKNYPSNTLNNIDMKRIGNDSDWAQIAAVSSYSVGIKKDGSLWFWGDDLLNSYLPSKPIKTINAPQHIGTDSDWMKISAGNKHVLLIKRDATLWVIGRNDSGQLGIGNKESTSTPLLIDSNKWKEVAAGSDCSFGIRSDGTLWSWGSNDLYALGLGATNITPNPNPISINFPVVNEVKSNDTDLNGITTPNAHVQISISSTVIASGKADDKGTFSIKINKQSVGTKLSIIAIDVNSQVSGVTTVSVLSDTNTSSSSSDHSSGSGDISSSTPDVEIPTEGKPVNTEPTKPTTKNVFTKNVDTVKVINSLKGKLLTAKESSAVAFTDIRTHWGSQNINVFVKLGVVSGYEDGSFHPDTKITRAEFATIISKIFNIEGSSNTLSLSDVKGHWAKDEIQALASHGIINGYEDGSFKPDNSITRAEIIAILSRIIELSTTQKLNNVTLGDVTGTWNVQQIKAAAEVGLIEGRNNSIFAPNEFSTRAESLTIILRALKLNPEIKFILDQMK